MKDSSDDSIEKKMLKKSPEKDIFAFEDPNKIARELFKNEIPDNFDNDVPFHAQEECKSCTLACGRMAVHYVEGRDIGEKLLQQDGKVMERDCGPLKTSIYNPADGTEIENGISNILDEAGFEVHDRKNDTIKNIRKFVSDGNVVIANVNAGKWFDREELNDSNHSILIKGYEKTPDDSYNLIIHDPGEPDGENMYVPEKKFSDAWASDDPEINNYMVLVGKHKRI